MDDFVSRALENRLHEDPTWLRLLHYRKSGDGYESEADGLNFFLSGPGGKTDPRQELVATIRGFFMGDDGLRRRTREILPAVYESGVQMDPNIHPSCMFPARREWLISHLTGLDRAAPMPSCPNLEIAQEKIHVESISLVFASYYMSEPASMFGHTLLKLNSGPEGHESKLLDYAVNYAAESFDVDPFSYVILGLTGGFQGRFSLMPYHLKVQEYNDSESRDIWEYELDLNEKQLHMAVLHLWELSSTHFNYYFMDENCSYHILGVIEVARPDVNLKDSFSGWVIPGETIRELFHHNGLVRRRIYRPSHVSLIEGRLESFDENEKIVFERLIDGETPQKSHFYELSEDSQLKVMDLALSVYRFWKETDRLEREERQEYLKLLRLRSKMPPGDSFVLEEPRSRPVEEGHPIHRMAMGVGAADGKPFVEWSFRPLLHDLMDKNQGYSERAELVYMDGKLRYYGGDQNPWLEKLDIIHVSGFAPVNFLSSPLSFELTGGFRTYYFQNRLLRTDNEEDFFYHDGLEAMNKAYGFPATLMLYDGTKDDYRLRRRVGQFAYRSRGMEFCEHLMDLQDPCEDPVYPWTEEAVPFLQPRLFQDDPTIRSSYAMVELFFGKSIGIGKRETNLQISFTTGFRARYDLFYYYRSTVLPGFRTMVYWGQGPVRVRLTGSIFYDRGETEAESSLEIGWSITNNQEMRLEVMADRNTSGAGLSYGFYF